VADRDGRNTRDAGRTRLLFVRRSEGRLRILLVREAASSKTVSGTCVRRFGATYGAG
jgi:hypothetical protein